MSVSDLTDNVRQRTESLQARWRALRSWVEATFLWRVWERLLENEFVDRSVALGTKCFVSFFPLVIVAAAFFPLRIRHSIIGTLQVRFGLKGQSVVTVERAFTSSADIRRATGLFGLFLLFFYATSFTTALQRAYLKAWRRPTGGRATDRLRGPAWLATILVFAALLGGVHHYLAGDPSGVAFAVVSVIGSTGLWWLTSSLMLRGQIRWRSLFLTGLLTGVGLTVFTGAASIWMPNAVASNQRQFGFFGVALALVSWFAGAGAVVIVGACAGASLADEPGMVGRLARGNVPSALKPGADPPLAPPTRALSIVNALGIHTGQGEGANTDDAPGTS